MSRVLICQAFLSVAIGVSVLPAYGDGLGTQGLAAGTASEDPTAGRMTRIGAEASVATSATLASAAERLSQKREAAASTDGEALSTRGAPANDDCINASAIAGKGPTQFDNAGATEDGPAHDACIDALVSPLGTIDKDLWYTWTSTCDGVVRVDTCGNNAIIDTKIAVYRGQTCPPTDAGLVNLGCNDDSCGIQSSVSFTASPDELFLLRVGTFPGWPGTCSGGSNPGADCFLNTECLDGGSCANVSAPPAPGGTETLSITCVDLPCDKPGENCQGGDPFNGFRSDTTFATVVDDFTPAVDAEVSSLCWQGDYIFDFPTPDKFEVRYYDNVDGLPGSLIGGPFVQAEGTLIVDGPENDATGVDFPVFDYSATHDPVSVSAGSCYWLEIKNDVPPNVWFWQTGLTGNGFYLHDAGECVGGNDDGKLCTVTECSGGQCPGPDGYEDVDLRQADLAFCLGEALGGTIFCQPPLAGNCADAVGDCLSEDQPITCASSAGCPAGRFCNLATLVCSDRRGCEDEICCNRVCACDPFCCSNGWDDFCAVNNLFTPSCDAPTRCPSIFAGCRAIVSSTPEHCTIDARQPFNIDGSNVAGFDEITLTFDEGCDAASIPSAFYQVRINDQSRAGVGSTSRGVAGVTTNGNTATLTFDAPIDVRQWTCVSHPELTGRACLGNLPGDVNGDGTSNPALDLGALIDCINNPGTCANYQANIDRTGTTPGVLDITRLIDLFNGAGSFDSFTGASLGACPAP